MSSINAFKILYNELLNDSEIPISASIRANKEINGKEAPSNREVGDFLLTAVELSSGEEFSRFIKYLGHTGYLETFLPEIDILKSCPQKKGRLRITDALDHTIMVVRYAPDAILALLALYHDAGKAYCDKGGYRGHDVKSAKIVYKRFIEFGYTIVFASMAYYVILNHMIPHDYQRRVKNTWSNERVIKFIRKCGNLENAIFTIQLAIADKRASHDIKDYLKPYYELERRCRELCPDKEKEAHALIYICPKCLGRDDSDTPAVNLKLSRATGIYFCPKCQAKFMVDAQNRLCEANIITVTAEVTNVGGEIEDEG